MGRGRGGEGCNSESCQYLIADNPCLSLTKWLFFMNINLNCQDYTRLILTKYPQPLASHTSEVPLSHLSLSPNLKVIFLALNEKCCFAPRKHIHIVWKVKASPYCASLTGLPSTLTQNLNTTKLILPLYYTRAWEVFLWAHFSHRWKGDSWTVIARAVLQRNLGVSVSVLSFLYLSLSKLFIKMIFTRNNNIVN